MLINTNLLINDPEIIKGLLDGTLKRHGSVIRHAVGRGSIVRHLVESPSLTNQLMTLPANPVLGTASILTDAVGHGVTIHKLNKTIDKVDQIQKTLAPILGFSQIAAGASVLNLGVSMVGFAYMGYKLNQVQKSLGKIQQSMEAGFNRLDERLDVLSGQLAYLHLLVEQNRQEQKQLSQAINELHRTLLIKEIADLRAELIERDRFPNSPIQQALKVASRVRMILADRAWQAQPELNPQTMLLTDVAVQGWAVATATETLLLLETGKINEAQELLSEEVPRFKQMAYQWADELLVNERPQLTTAYRFTAPCFKQHISLERVERIADISQSDRFLSPKKREEQL